MIKYFFFNFSTGDVILTFSTKQDSKEKRLISTSAWEEFSGRTYMGVNVYAN